MAEDQWKTEKLDRLKVEILDHGERVDQLEFDDPREAWAERFNRDWNDVGLEARVA